MPIGMRVPSSRRSGQGQKRREIQACIAHRQLPCLVARPILRRTVPVKFDPIAIGITEINRLRHAMIGRPIQTYTGIDRAAQNAPQCGTIRVEKGSVIKPRRIGRRAWAARAVPGVQPKVVVIAVEGQKRRFRAEILLYFKAECGLVKGDLPR